MLKVAFLISDEGYGHVVRQREIIRYLLKNVKNIKIKVFTSKNYLYSKKHLEQESNMQTYIIIFTHEKMEMDH